jgi:pimeloyl-ACP methyl ester carboxylesterase
MALRSYRLLALVFVVGLISIATSARLAFASSGEAGSPELRAQIQRFLARDPQSNGAGARLLTRLPNSAKLDLLHELGSGSYSVLPSFLFGESNAFVDPSAVPAGANLPCKLTAAHPRPVILVHGTAEDMEDNWGAIAPILANNGYCVYALNYGGAPDSVLQALAPIPYSAQIVARFIDRVRISTLAAKVDVVGHSEGGTVLEYAAKVLGRAYEIDHLIRIVPPTHGTSVSGLLELGHLIPGAHSVLDYACPACVEMEYGSPVVRQLAAPPMTQPFLHYTVIETRADEVVSPTASAFINEQGVNNEYIQRACPYDAADHITISYDLVAIQLLMNALDPATARPPDCLLAFPVPA